MGQKDQCGWQLHSDKLYSKLPRIKIKRRKQLQGVYSSSILGSNAEALEGKGIPPK